jgi:carbon-monoxide dehydrogenase medium subunit
VKAAAFELVAPPDFPATLAALQATPSQPLAGGQSLMAMLNYRVARPPRLVQLGRPVELFSAEASEDAVTIGATVTHAAIEDGLVPDIGEGILPTVAGGIAYRAVRNRGTIGGSLCHADPAADWVTVLTALGASVLLVSVRARRSVSVADFITGAYRTALVAGEVLQAVRIPRLQAGAKWAYVKACRKPGAFAHCMAAVLRQPAGQRRVAVGALGSAPLLMETSAIENIARKLPGDDVSKHMAGENLRRAWALTD